MPRIRKKSSNRQNTRDRAKITKKVKEHKKKTRKASKKDVTWKSNKKKDTVIPNSFPFKDQVLAEQAEEKRAADEAKLNARRKPVEEEEDAPGIGSVNSTVLTATASLPTKTAAVAEEADEIPDLVDTQLTSLQDCLDRADVVLQVVDARDIAGCRNKWVEGLVSDAGGKFGLVVNKVDLVPRETLESWLPHLPEHTFLFKSFLPTANIAASSSKTQLPHNPEQCLGKEELLAAFAGWSKEAQKDEKEPLVVAFFGLPNVGKTSVLNSLLGRAKGKYPVAPVVPIAAAAKQLGTTTTMPAEVPVQAAEGVKVHVIDTPGWEPAPEDIDEDEDEDEDEDDEVTEEQMAKYDRLEATLAGDLLRRNIGRIDKIKDVFPLANYIISRSNPQDLMLAYNVPYFTPGDVEGFLTSLARVGARMKKGGEADLDSAARLLMRDWSYNVFPYYCIPPKGVPSSASTITASAKSVLEKVRSKKEMRTSGSKGLVRFKGGEVDEREVIMDDDYTAMLAPSDDEDEGHDCSSCDGEDEEDEDEDEEDDDEDVPILIGADDGEELELEDGPEPSSGSDVAEGEDEDESEEEEEEPIEVPVKASANGSKLKRKLAPSPDKKQTKRARSGTMSGKEAKAAANGKAKRVSFGKDVVLNAGEDRAFKGLGKRRR